MPKGVRLKREQVVAKLREIEVKLSQGKDVLTSSAHLTRCHPLTQGLHSRLWRCRVIGADFEINAAGICWQPSINFL